MENIVSKHYHFTIRVDKEEYDYVQNLLSNQSLPEITIESDDELLAKLSRYVVVSLIRLIQIHKEPS